MKLLIINPGSTSTKLALYDGAKKLLQENLEHDAAALQQYHGIGDQVPMRLAVIRDFLDRSGVHPEELAAVIGRGGLVFGLKTGGYLVNEDLCHALVDDDLSQPHASNLGGLLAREIAAPLGIPAYIYDAVTSGELTDVAKITGFVDIERRSFCHVLNSRAMALRYAREHGKHYEELNLIVAHLGGGISASVHRHGEIIDSVGDDDGQFSPERSGCVPSLGLIKLCYSGKYTYEEMRKKIRGRGGMYAHLGTSDDPRRRPPRRPDLPGAGLSDREGHRSAVHRAQGRLRRHHSDGRCGQFQNADGPRDGLRQIYRAGVRHAR